MWRTRIHGERILSTESFLARQEESALEIKETLFETEIQWHMKINAHFSPEHYPAIWPDTSRSVVHLRSGTPFVLPTESMFTFAEIPIAEKSDGFRGWSRLRQSANREIRVRR
jgi:hypothetical protein